MTQDAELAFHRGNYDTNIGMKDDLVDNNLEDTPSGPVQTSFVSYARKQKITHFNALYLCAKSATLMQFLLLQVCVKMMFPHPVSL